MPTAPPPSPTTPAVKLTPYRLSADQFRAMIAAGLFEGSRVELISGLLVEKLEKSPPHDVAIGELHDNLFRMVPTGWYVDEAKSIGIGPRDQPEPDLVVLRGRRRDYLERHPSPAAIGILVEVADTSYPRDRGPKWRRYAAAGIGTYWIVHLTARRIEVYEGPEGRGRAASSRNGTHFAEDAEVPVILDGAEVGRFTVGDILP